jgi:hypothetical protein
MTASSCLVYHRRTGSLVAFGLVMVALLAPHLALADESEGDQDVARELREHRDIVSLDDIVKRIERQDHGVVVSVELIRVGKYWVCRPQVVRFVSGRLSRPGMFDPHRELTCFAQLSSLSF